MSKKVLSFQQNHEGVMLRFSDNTTVHGDILVGADGAHSGVRKHLYKTLDEQGLLPKGDTKIMNTGYMALVGTTLPLDPSEERYKDLAAEDSKCSFHIGDNSTPFTWMTYTVPGNRICWNVVIQLELAEIEEEQFRRSDWAPETNGKILDQIREFKTTYGPLGDIVDATPRERISKVFFEDMLFETWTHGRTVLIGDGKCSLSFLSYVWDTFVTMYHWLIELLYFFHLLHSCTQGTTYVVNFFFFLLCNGKKEEKEAATSRSLFFFFQLYVCLVTS